jgi:hypothetical protein
MIEKTVQLRFDFLSNQCHREKANTQKDHGAIAYQIVKK